MEDTMRTTATISRIRGFMCIAEAGDYQFAIAAGKEGRIYLSPTADSSNAPSIGSSFGDYGPRAIVDAGQRSAILTFTAGQRIYLSALWGGVTKHYGTVLWRTPGSTTFVPIPASAFTSNAPIPSLQPTAVEQEATTAITLYPNPSKRQGEVYLEGMTGRGHMEVLSSTGGLVIRAELPAQTGRRNLSQLSGLNSGVYVVHLKTSNSRPMRQRLVVE